MKALFLGLLLAGSILTAKAQSAAIDKITTSYISVKDALVASNAPLAKSRSAELLTALSAPMKGLKPAQGKLLATYLNKLKYDSRDISKTTVLARQREHFQSLSQNMIGLVSGLKLNTATVYQQYCPMKKASWLSESEEIRNPYYGDEMLECGEVKATIKGK
jgi:hypothetical protein